MIEKIEITSLFWNKVSTKLKSSQSVLTTVVSSDICDDKEDANVTKIKSLLNYLFQTFRNIS